MGAQRKEQLTSSKKVTDKVLFNLCFKINRYFFFLF